jgi:hypothetical protein
MEAIMAHTALALLLKAKAQNKFQSLHLPVHSEQASAIAWS